MTEFVTCSDDYLTLLILVVDCPKQIDCDSTRLKDLNGEPMAVQALGLKVFKTRQLALPQLLTTSKKFPS